MAEETTQEQTKIISKIHLPEEISGVSGGVTYDIYDAKALHKVEELGLSGVLTFKGVVDIKEIIEGEEAEGKTALPSTGNEIGDVYYVREDDYEYVWIDTDGDLVGDTWEQFGTPHDFVGTKDFEGHTHEFTDGSVTISDFAISGTVPAYQADTTYLSATATEPIISSNGTASVLKGDAKTTISAVKMVETTPGTQKAGEAAKWAAKVNDGVLTFEWTTNTPSTVAETVVTSVTADTGSIDVSFSGQTTNVVTSWTATAPEITLKSGNSGDVSVATGVSTSGANSISNGKATGATVTITGGTVGSVKLPASTT